MKKSMLAFSTSDFPFKTLYHFFLLFCICWLYIYITKFSYVSESVKVSSWFMSSLNRLIYDKIIKQRATPVVDVQKYHVFII